MTQAKKEKLKQNPSRVRFAEGVVVNGSPLYKPHDSPMATNSDDMYYLTPYEHQPQSIISQGGNMTPNETSARSRVVASVNSDESIPYIPNVLKVFLENGQTKTFKYDSNTTVQVSVFRNFK